MIQIRIWDWPTRIFHWSLATLVVALVITGNVGGNTMVWHFRCGYAVLSLLIFRFIWGFCGGHWSRWRQLACTPELIWQYFKTSSSSSAFLGHNPAGSLSVIAMLTLLVLQVSTGLFSDDEIFNAGPLASLVAQRLWKKLDSFVGGRPYFSHPLVFLEEETKPDRRHVEGR